MGYDTSSDKTGIPCARPDCRCLVFDDNEDENVHRSAFCSTGCAGGLGCDHHECNCSSAVSTPVLVAKSGILEVQSYGATDRGLRRATNQDHFMTARLRKSMEVDHTSIPSDEHARFQSNVQGQLLLVADGMGGHAAGERASQLAVDSAAAYVLNTIPWFYRLSASCDDDFQDELKRALEFCQRELSRDIDNQPMNRNMGTTLTMAYVIGEHLYVVHVGDSRCYLLRDGRLHQITRDHTVAQDMVDQGLLSPEQLSSSPFSHLLWNAVGGSEQSVLKPDVYKSRLHAGDMLLLCTDGLTRHLDDKTLESALNQSHSIEATAHDLIDAAKAGGGTDNITVVIASLGATAARAPQPNS